MIPNHYLSPPLLLRRSLYTPPSPPLLSSPTWPPPHPLPRPDSIRVDSDFLLFSSGRGRWHFRPGIEAGWRVLKLWIKYKSMIFLDFNNSLISISFAYCSWFTIYFDKVKSIWYLSYYFRLGRGNKINDKSMISLDFNNGFFQSHLHIVVD